LWRTASTSSGSASCPAVVLSIIIGSSTRGHRQATPHGGSLPWISSTG
jgi:hypothetical protein